MILHRKSQVSILIYLYIIILMSGCAYDAIQSSELVPKDIKILISDVSNYYVRRNTFLQVVDGNVLEITIFTDRYSGLDFDVFDIDILYRFVSDMDIPALESMWYPSSEHFIVESGERLLSPRQLNNIWRLAGSVVIADADSDFERVHSYAPRVWAIIDGDIYWSLYISELFDSIYSERFVYNPELLRLAYYFIDLSPIRMGYELSNEIRTEWWERHMLGDELWEMLNPPD